MDVVSVQSGGAIALEASSPQAKLVTGPTKPESPQRDAAPAVPAVSSHAASDSNVVDAEIGVLSHIETHPTEIVTVFTNLQTGQEIEQFPAEVVVANAKFYDAALGGVIDRNA